jgi:hypothetical protein
VLSHKPGGFDLSKSVSVLEDKAEFYANDRVEKGLLEAAGVKSTDEIKRMLLFFRYAGYDYATLYAFS